MPLFDQITIVGMGLLGGSVGIAAKQRKIAKRVVGLVRNKKHRAEILKRKAADVVLTEYATAIPSANLIVLAVPVSAMADCAKDALLHLSPEAVITDVGSVKGPIVASMESIFARKGSFVGAHPMAGSEKRGIGPARGDLFEKALCILTPGAQSNPKAVTTVQKFWRALGSRTRICTAEDHDRIVAAVSHLPHLLAACLMHTTSRVGEGFEDPVKFIGPSFRDVTRIAASSAELWTDIVMTNRDAILQASTSYVGQMEDIKDILATRDRQGLFDFFKKAQGLRENLS